VLDPGDGPPPPIDQYDLMVIDECHRGYLLDREMSDAELAFRNQEDYVSKYRRRASLRRSLYCYSPQVLPGSPRHAEQTSRYSLAPGETKAPEAR